jgi:hypothetical protein
MRQTSLQYCEEDAITIGEVRFRSAMAPDEGVRITFVAGTDNGAGCYGIRHVGSPAPKKETSDRNVIEPRIASVYAVPLNEDQTGANA